MLKSLLSVAHERINERGNRVRQTNTCCRNVNWFASDVCPASQGWEQWTTKQDTAYFGVWVHRANHEIVTYAWGDIVGVTCSTPDAFKAEIAHLEAFYGEPPVVAVDVTEHVTEHVAGRLSAAEI